MTAIVEALGSSISPTILSVSGLIFILYYAFQLLRPKAKTVNLPLYGKPKQANYWDSLIEGGKENKGKPFLLQDVPHESPTMILPTKYMNDVKSLPEDVASFNASIYKHQAGKYTGLGMVSPTILQSVKVDLTRNIARTLDGLQDETEYCIPATIGECEDWTPVTFYPALARIVAHLSGRIFVGLPLCREEAWIQSTINYTFDVFGAIEPIFKVNPLLRPFQAWNIPEVKRLLEHLVKGQEMLKPVLEKHMENQNDPDHKRPFDMVETLYQNSKQENKNHLPAQTELHMMLSLAAIHTTAMSVTHVMYELCAHPEHIQPLRDELEEMMAADGGKFVKTSMTKLRKMDSFIKESQRFSPPSMISLNRQAMKDITLHDGVVIPAGTLFAFSSIGINSDPELFPDPHKFDGFRFSKLRDNPENSNKYQFVTTGLDAVAFGHGVHACPGRFFASNEIKIILAGLLLRYDFSLGEGGAKGERPPNVLTRTSIMPDTTAKIYFKKRSAA